MENFSTILEKVGSKGKYQIIVCGLLISSTIQNGFQSMVPVFSHETPNHYCKIPQLETLASEQNISRNSPEYHRWLHYSLPEETNSEGNFERSKCQRYSDLGFAWNGTAAIPTNKNNSERVIIDCDHGWIYEDTTRVTIATEWDIVCSKSWMLPLATSLFMIGILTGSLISGILSDRYGRRRVFLFGTAAMVAAIVLNSFSVNIEMYMTTFFFVGVNGLINYVSAFVLATEITSISTRSLIGSLEIAGYALGYMLMSPTAYFISHWKWLMRVQGLFALTLIPYYIWIPESPVWLIYTGKKEAAIKIIKKMAKINKRPIKEADLQQTLLSTDNTEAGNIQDTKDNKYTYLDLLRYSSIRKRSLVVSYIWAAVAMIYYGTSLNTSNLGGDKYINCFISAAVEIPSYFACYFFLEWLGRRSILAICLFSCSTSLAITPFLKQASEALMVAVAMVGKFFISACFNIIYIYTCELFPTLMRNMGMGAASTVARIGAIIAPYLIYMGEQVDFHFPYLVMASIGMLAAALCLLLPETKSIALPETLEDAKALERFRIKPKCLSRKNYNTKVEESTMS